MLRNGPITQVADDDAGTVEYAGILLIICRADLLKTAYLGKLPTPFA